MNRIEFNEVMKAVGINNPLSTTNGRYGTSEQVHYWQNMAINFGGSYYAIIHGKIPFEVANIIYEKYPGNPYEIRIDGGCSDYIPSEHVTDDKYKRDIQEYAEQDLDPKEFIAKCRNARRNLSRRKTENKYIDTYHIDTKEGLVILLTEMKDYYARTHGLPETEVQRFNEVMATINSEILKKVEPSIPTNEWMKGDEENKEIFFETISKGTRTSFGKEFREAIDNFDKVVNPFINENVELEEVGNYIQKVNISANTYDREDGKYRKKCCQVHITDLETQNKVSYYRSPDGFSYQLKMKLDEEQYLMVLHYYSNTGNDENDKGEVIAVEYFGDKAPQRIDLRYNITKGVVGTTYGEKTPITPEQKEFIYDELVKAEEYASTITINNMRKSKYKTLKLI